MREHITVQVWTAVQCRRSHRLEMDYKICIPESESSDEESSTIDDSDIEFAVRKPIDLTTDLMIVKPMERKFL